MSQRRFHLAALAAAVLSACCATIAVAGPWALAPGEYYTELRGSFFSSGTYYDNDGNRLSVGGLLEQRMLRSYTELGWKKHWSVQLSLPALSNTVRASSGPTATSTGFGDFDFGLRYAFKNGPGAAALQLDWSAPSGYETNIPPGLGSGLQQLSATLQLGQSLGQRGFFQLGGGYAYDYRTIGSRETNLSKTASERDWSDHALVDAALGLWLGGRLQVAGLYDGRIAGTTGRTVKTTTHLAGPRFTYRVDQRLDAFAGSWHSPGGKNVLHVDEFYAGIAWKQTKLNRLQGFLGGDKRP
jgi:hypothetical protein